jgi:Sensors of blue-light using FAD
LLSIAYVSSAITPMSEDDIAALLIAARANNRRHGITGALLYQAGRFIQIIEGPDAVLRERFDVIAADPRHRSVRVLRERAIAEREFPEWTMGFAQADSTAGSHLPGYENIFGRRGAERLKHADNESQQYLEWLAEYWLPSAVH